MPRVAAGVDHRDPHPSHAEPFGRHLGQRSAYALVSGWRINGQHLDLPKESVSVELRCDESGEPGHRLCHPRLHFVIRKYGANGLVLIGLPVRMQAAEDLGPEHVLHRNEHRRPRSQGEPKTGSSSIVKRDQVGDDGLITDPSIRAKIDEVLARLPPLPDSTLASSEVRSGDGRRIVGEVTSTRRRGPGIVRLKPKDG